MDFRRKIRDITSFSSYSKFPIVQEARIMTAGHGIALDGESRSQTWQNSREKLTQHPQAKHPLFRESFIPGVDYLPRDLDIPPISSPCSPHPRHFPPLIVSIGFKIASTKISKTARGRVEKGSSAPRARTSTTPWW